MPPERRSTAGGVGYYHHCHRLAVDADIVTHDLAPKIVRVARPPILLAAQAARWRGEKRLKSRRRLAAAAALCAKLAAVCRRESVSAGTRAAAGGSRAPGAQDWERGLVQQVFVNYRRFEGVKLSASIAYRRAI